MITQVIILGVLILLSGFFSGAEIAFFSLSEAKVFNLVKQKKKNSHIVKHLKKHPQQLLITILIGNNLVNIGSSALATVVAINMFGSVGVGIATGLMTAIILIIGEIIPKSIAQKNAANISRKISLVLWLLFYLLWPISFVLAKFSKLINLIFNRGKREEVISEEEIIASVHLGVKKGIVEKDEKEMIDKIFELNDITAKDVMTVRSQMTALEINQDINEVLATIKNTGYSRFPIYQGDLDNIEGILYVKDLLHALAEKDKSKIKLKELAKLPIFIPEQKLLDDLLKEFQAKRIHLGIVVNEHGEVMGIATLEDLLEEIVGEIVDETDISKNLIKRVDKRTILVDSETPLTEINDFFNIKLSAEEHRSISWLILKKLGSLPKQGDEIALNKNVKAIIEETEAQKIKWIKLIKIK